MTPEAVSAAALLKGAAEIAGPAAKVWSQLAADPAKGLPASQVRPRALENAGQIVGASADLLALARPLDDGFNRLGPIPDDVREADQNFLTSVDAEEALRRIGVEGPPLLAQLWESQDRAIPPLDPETQRRLHSVVFWHGVMIQLSRELAEGADPPESPEALVKGLTLRAVVGSARSSHEQLQDGISRSVVDLPRLDKRGKVSRLRRRDARDDAFRRRLIADMLHSHADVVEDIFAKRSRRQRALRWARRKWHRALGG
ncbi:MAG: hypothetical protein ACJ760_02245 [Thermoleophilaceae bacterium]